ncbi:MAG: cytidylate kinase family protein [Lachnospiraceae bacterium]|nr:cytidylate kinase family protein [Lachnospiraceae bacterium]
MHITLTGNLGSGKSTISKIMAEKYGFEIYSTGKVIREFAAEKGISVLEMNQLMQKDNSYDHLIDDRTRQISIERKDDLFFDSRLAWHFAVNTFKVFLSVDIDEAARRVFNDDRGDTEKYKTQEDAKAQLIERAHTEDQRYKDIYGIDYFKISNYNLILDSTFSKPELLAEVLISEKRRYEEAIARGETPETRIILAPARLAGRSAGNLEDNGKIREVDAAVRMKIETFDVEYGLKEIEKAADEDYEFVIVKGID